MFVALKPAEIKTQVASKSIAALGSTAKYIIGGTSTVGKSVIPLSGKRRAGVLHGW